MKVILSFLAVTLLVSFAYAQSSIGGCDSAALADAITLCPAGSNPLEALKETGANRFTHVRVSGDSSKTILATLVSDPAAHNHAIAAPLRMVGLMSLKMEYASDRGFDRPLVCTMKVRSGMCLMIDCAAPPAQCNYDFTQAPHDEFGCAMGCGPLICEDGPQ